MKYIIKRLIQTDFVTLETGILINIKTTEDVWSLNSPFLLEKPNLGNHIDLIDKIAKTVAESIVQK